IAEIVECLIVVGNEPQYYAIALTCLGRLTLAHEDQPQIEVARSRARIQLNGPPKKGRGGLLVARLLGQYPQHLMRAGVSRVRLQDLTIEFLRLAPIASPMTAHRLVK